MAEEKRSGVAELADLFRGLTGAAERLDEVQRGDTDPLHIVDALLGRAPSQGSEPERWWFLFGLTERPVRRPVLDAAWRRWAVRHHPDKGGDAISFGHMRSLYERMAATLPA